MIILENITVLCN